LIPVWICGDARRILDGHRALECIHLDANDVIDDEIPCSLDDHITE
jgi:hypothetical protein